MSDEPQSGKTMPDHDDDGVYGLGTDVIDAARVGRYLARGNEFRDLVFTAQEIAYCEGTAQSALHYAARFAAKEAFLKAMGTGLTAPLHLCEIELTRTADGRPGIVLHGGTKAYADARGVTAIHVSLSHIKEIASAVVLVVTHPASKQMVVHETYVTIDAIRQFLGEAPPECRTRKD